MHTPMPPRRQPALLVCAVAGALLAACAAPAPPPAARPGARLDYPVAPRGDTVDDYHGVKVADPYRGFEDLDSPATRGWVNAEAALTASYFDTLPQRAALRARIGALYDFERTGIPFSENGRYFYSDNSGQQNQSVLLTVSPLNGLVGVALDPNVLPPDGNPIVVGYVASPDGALVAYGVSLSGSDWTDWHVREVASGNDRPDVIRNTKYYAPVFSADGRGLYYSAFPAPKPGAELSTADLGNGIYYHVLGTAAAQDRQLFADPAHPERQFLPHLSDDGRWLVLTSGEGEVGDKGVEDIYLIDTRAARAQAVQVTRGFEAAYEYAGSDGGRLYFLTTLGAPNGRVVAIDPLQPQQALWQAVIPEGADAIELGAASVNVVAHQLLVRAIHDAHSRVLRYALDGTVKGEIALPGPGTALGFAGRSNAAETFYSFSDLVTPPTIYRYDFASNTSSVFRAPRVAYDPARFETRQVFYPGKDGTRIPLLLAYARGTRLNGNNPLLLYGYGGFGISVLPRFDPATIAWLEQGGVYAIANIRGGGEYGEAWHRQGTLTHKQVVFDDFIAAAQWLIAQHYTSTPRLAIRGGSNGGLLAGACLTQRPDLYGAVIAQVGVLDMLRFNRFGQGAGWEGDYGSPQDPQQFRALYAYSPVHNVRPGVRYPATLVVTGDHDTRVMPMHSFKFAAALQAAQAGPAPVLLMVDIASGHGGGETVTQAIAQKADMYAFLMRNLDWPAAAH
ncbi:MAG TPA: prolyl oligopeptidase family serine peptidase [Steroidobacteraceae bacterium]|nr:prolyl oligopeptidase family serine peptidase [Steroidobacteraceae bacterium]